LRIVTFRADELEEPNLDMRGGAVLYHGPLGGSPVSAKSNLCDPTSSSTTANNSDIGRHRQEVRKLTTSLLTYAACKVA